MAATKKAATKTTASKAAPKVAPKAAAEPAPAAPPVSSGSDDKTMAVLAHALGTITGFIAALVIWLVKKDSPVVERHAREALNFQITVLIASVVAGILWIILIGVFLSIAIMVVNIVFCILAAVAASKGNDYRYPFALRLIKGPA